MRVLLDSPLSLRNRLRILRIAWSVGDFRGTFRVLLFGRTGPAARLT